MFIHVFNTLAVSHSTASKTNKRYVFSFIPCFHFQIFFSLHFAEILTYLNVLACAVNGEPWECVYQRSGRALDLVEDVLVKKENELKGNCLYID